ncbi:MAG: thiamine pyrophosphate-dependent enzyme [Chthoniobacterales bacterium]|nr:thiamine pyrophosphate-dependent enzyme [Chthoniobacterales bacterium]
MARKLSKPSQSKKSAPKKAVRPVVSKPKSQAKPLSKATPKKGGKKPLPLEKAPAKKAPSAPKAVLKDATKTPSKVDFSKSPFNASLKPAQKIGYLREMLRIRRFEQQALKYYNQGIMGGFLHLYNGQESVAVGTASLMNGHDEIITAYRDHGHALAVGMGMNECMAELFGKGTGCSKGKGGSMHFFAPDKHYWGGHGIVAGQTPLGLGLAFAIKYKKINGCAVAFLGDGAVNQGVFSECLNMAALWDLPIVYVIENNGYSMGTSLERSSAVNGSLAKRAEGFCVEWATCEGFDLYELRANLGAAMERARKESKPMVLEVSTYRYYGHSVADANAKKYRAPEEIELYKSDYDPITRWQNQLLKEKTVTQAQIEKIDDEAKAEAAAAVEFGIASPWPSEESIFEDIYHEVDHKTEAGQTGRFFFSE